MVSIVIPCRNEKEYIGKCLVSIICQSDQKDGIEVLVVDGLSTDGTKDIQHEYATKYPFVHIIENCRKITPVALNLGILAAKGDFIMLLGSHTRLEVDALKKITATFDKYEADCVGGLIKTLPAADRITARSIAEALAHPFGVGNSYFRIGIKDPKYVDTVPFGCYKREVFEKIGLFDEDLVRNQDDEFNLRLIKNGGKILLVPDIVSYYYARDSLPKVWKMFYQYGYFKPLVALKVGGVLTWRQLVPAFFIVSLLGSLLLSLVFKPFFWIFLLISFLYCFVNLGISFYIAIKKGWKHFFMLPIVFATVHFSYGIGYFKGLLDFMLLRKHKKNKLKDIPLTR